MGYIINGIEHSYDSPKNQSIVDKLVSREVYCCMTSEMEYMLGRVYENDSDNPFAVDDYEESLCYRTECYECGAVDSYDEIDFSELADSDFPKAEDDTYECPICGLEYTELKDAKDCCSYEQTVFKCSKCGKILSEYDYTRIDSKPVEVFEWWAVSKWFGEKLREHGCVVIDAWGKDYWGRECTGQAIALDGCIIQIAADMGILEGMECEWRC